MDVQIFDHDGRDNSVLYKFAHSGRQKAIVAAGFSRFERARIFEASFSTLSAESGQSTTSVRSAFLASLVSSAGDGGQVRRWEWASGWRFAETSDRYAMSPAS
jgi:hypothetical protein